MDWRDRIPRTLTKAHLKAVQVLQGAGIKFEIERCFPLQPRGFVVADIYLPQHGANGVRLECDGEFHKGRRLDRDQDKDARLLAQHGIPTVRLENRRILRRDGEAYVLATLEVKAVEA